MDKQVTNQSKKGNNNNWKKKSLANNSSKPAVTEVLTGYEVSSLEEQGRIRDIIFNSNWTTDLGGIPVRWFPASWTLRERKQREKFQAVVYNIPEDITTHTLWRDQKLTTYLCEFGAKSFKIVQTGKGKRKLVGFFKTWEAVRKVLDYHQVLSSEGIRLSWCQHSTPNLKKVPTTKDRSGGKKADSSNAKSKKKDQQSSSKAPNKSNKLKKPLGQNTKDSENSDNSKKKVKGGNNSNKEVLAKILELLQKLV
ncbi:hypothetical protein C1646_765412 [Rhizophagus diaphanus]|nr:hypothetical protein C1646_765412 [Rhizophagus diaphanus] [Rhizophagus sp. MUCL 43196]